MLAFLFMMAAVLLVLIVVVIYLNDRVNQLEHRTVTIDAALPATPVALADSGWHGLSGKRLWDAMAGKPVQGVSPEAVEMLRPHYESVVAKHIQGLFRDGLRDAAESKNGSATAVRKVVSTRGPVDSWMPLNVANVFYRAGADSLKDDVFEIERIRMSIDEAAEVIYAQTNLPMLKPWSQVLMPDPEVERAEAEAAAAAQAEAAAQAQALAASGLGAQQGFDLAGPGFGPAGAASAPGAAPGLGMAPGLGISVAPPAPGAGGSVFDLGGPAASRPPPAPMAAAGMNPAATARPRMPLRP